jgi:geranylgeranyl pyrophosphate synthase
MSLACEAVGGNPKLTEEAASSLILVAAGIDIHDDIIDKSLVKDYGQTILGAEGLEITLLVGDMLFVKGLISMALSLIGREIPYDRIKMILALTERLLLELSDAEAGELRLRRRIDITPRSYLRLTRMKAADVEAYMRIGSILGGGSRTNTDALGRYGRSLGMIVILRDDLSDLLDFKEELPHRIEYEHLPLPIFYAVRNSTYKKRITSLLQRSKIREEDAEELLKITYEAGGLASYEKTIKRLVYTCRRELKLLPQSKARSTLEDVVDATAPPSLSHLEF